MSTWLITGCSIGLGRALAEAVLDAGNDAVIAARNAGALARGTGLHASGQGACCTPAGNTRERSGLPRHGPARHA